MNKRLVGAALGVLLVVLLGMLFFAGSLGLDWGFSKRTGHETAQASTASAEASQTADGPTTGLAPDADSEYESGTRDRGGSGEDEANGDPQAQTKKAEKIHLFGKVVMAEGGEVVAGARVDVAGSFERARKAFQTTTNGDGLFEFHIEPVSQIGLWASKDGLISTTNLQGEGGRIALTEDTTSVGPLILRLVPGHLMKVRVVDAGTKSPIANPEASLIGKFKAIFLGNELGEIQLTLTPERWAIEFHAQGYAKQIKYIELTGLEASDLVVALDRGGSIFGKVVSADEKPIENCRISVSGQWNLNIVTDSRGEFEINYLELNRTFSLNVSHEEYQTKAVDDLRLTAGNPNLPVKVVMVPGKKGKAVVTGVVTDRNNQPLADVAIGTNADTSHPELGVQSGPAGQYRLEVTAGNSKISASKPGFVTLSQFVSVQPGEITELNLRLYPGKALSGRVVDEDHRPLEKVMIQWSGRLEGMIWGRAESNKEGEFQLEGLPPDVHLRFSKKGYSQKEVADIDFDQKEIEVVMPAQGVILGQVLDSKRKTPLSAFEVGTRASQVSPSMTYYSSNPPWLEYPAKDGKFRLEGLEINRKVMLLIRAEGYATGTFDPVQGKASEESEIRIFELDPARNKIKGRVVDRGGEPRSGAVIYLLGAESSRRGVGFLDWNSLQEGRNELSVFEYQTTKGDGSFEFAAVGEGMEIVLAVHGGGAAMTRIEILADKDPAELENLIITTRDAGRILGRVNRKKFEGSLRVWISNQSSHMLFLSKTIPAANDHFEFRDLPPGEVQLELAPSGNSRGDSGYSVTIPMGEGEEKHIDVGFEEGYRVAGTVLMNGQPMVGGKVFLHRTNLADGMYQNTTSTDGAGQFAIEGVLPGEYQLYAFRSNNNSQIIDRIGGFPNKRELTIGEKDFYDTFSFTRLGDLKGRLSKDLGGNLYLTNQASRYRGWMTGLAPPALEGPFLFEELAPGIYDLGLKAMSAGFRSKILLPGIVIPEDGSDVDLGLLDLDDLGSVRVRLAGTGWESALPIPITVHSERETESNHSILAQEIVHEPKSEVLIDKIPSGPARITIRFYEVPWVSDPSSALVDVVPEGVGEVEFRIRPITYLKLEIPDPEVKIKSAIMTHASDGSSLNFILDAQQGSEAWRLDGPNLAIYTNRSCIAKNVATGMWNLRLTDRRDRVWEAQVDLQAGVLIHRSVDFK